MIEGAAIWNFKMDDIEGMMSRIYRQENAKENKTKSVTLENKSDFSQTEELLRERRRRRGRLLSARQGA